MKHSSVITSFVLVGALLALQPICHGQDRADGKPLTLGDAMNAAIVPHQTVQRYPDYVSVGAKGIVQRSLFDFKNAKKNVQIAFVIDATNTMTHDIESLRQELTTFVEGIKQQIGGVSNQDNILVEIAILVYRDMWKTYDFDKDELVAIRPDPVEILTQVENNVEGFLEFDRDSSQIGEILKSLSTEQIESGDPGFPEQVDRGIHSALEKLHWSSQQDVTRVIVVAGDAPPWEETYTEYNKNPDWWTYWEKERTLRGYKTTDLIDLAKKKHIIIHAIVCQSAGISASQRAKILRIHGPDIEHFFGALAAGTNGSFLNLADTGTIETLHNVTVGRQIELVQLKDVTDSDVEAFRSESTIRLAVLPLFPLNTMTFSDYELDSSAPALDIQTDLIYRLQQIEGRNVIPRRQLQKEWSRFADGANVAPTDLHELARRLDVDFLIWGDCQSVSDSGTVQVALRAYSYDGTTIISARSVKGKSNEVAGQAFRRLTDSMREASQGSNRKARGFVRLYGSADASRGVDLIAHTKEAHSELMKGIRQLEEATAVDAGTEGSRTDLLNARKHIEMAMKTDPDNLIALVFLANCEYDLHSFRAGNDDLRRAFGLAKKLDKNDPLRLEIEADNTLFVQRNPLKAIEFYEELVAATRGRQPESSPRQPQAVVRALWMLAGLYLGDWGAAEKWQVDDRQKDPESEKQLEKKRLDLARDSILEIIADWPETPEAEYYSKCFSPPLQRKKREVPDNADVQLANKNQPHKVFVPTLAQPKMAGGQIKTSDKDAG